MSGEVQPSTPMSDEEILGIGGDEQARPGGQARPSGGQGSDAAEIAGGEAAQGRGIETAQKSSGERREESADPPLAQDAEELRTYREAFPGGAAEAQQLRETARAVEQIDAAIYSGDAGAQSQLVAEMARTNPAAFRQLFAEAARLLSTDGQRGATHDERRDSSVGPIASDLPQNDRATGRAAATESRQREGDANHEQQVTSQGFDAATYATFERGTNDAVARDVRSAISSTLERVLPDGIAEGAARRIGDDIFAEIHRTLAADQALSAQVGEVLRGWQFGAGEQQRVASLLAARAKQVLPGVARRVIGEWSSSVLGAARSKAARQSAAASRVDIGTSTSSAGPGAPRGASREIDYRAMSDEDILSL